MNIIAILFVIGVSPTPMDEALHNLETLDANAKGKQEKSLETIEKTIKNGIGLCLRQCPPCTLHGLTLEARVVGVQVDGVVQNEIQLRGNVELVRLAPSHQEKLAEVPFSVLIPPTKPAHLPIPAWLWAVGGVAIGFGVGALMMWGIQRR